jgi:hypothetical protein
MRPSAGRSRDYFRLSAPAMASRRRRLNPRAAPDEQSQDQQGAEHGRAAFNAIADII